MQQSLIHTESTVETNVKENMFQFYGSTKILLFCTRRNFISFSPIFQKLFASIDNLFYKPYETFRLYNDCGFSFARMAIRFCVLLFAIFFFVDRCLNFHIKKKTPNNREFCQDSLWAHDQISCALPQLNAQMYLFELSHFAHLSHAKYNRSQEIFVLNFVYTKNALPQH